MRPIYNFKSETMIKITSFILASWLILTTSCTISVNEKNSAENSADGNGFMYDNREVTVNGVFSLKNNEIYAGEYIVMNFKGVQNALEKDGYHHVGIAIKISTSTGEVLEESDDLYANMELQSADYNIYYAYYGVPTSLSDGEQLTIELTLFDKFGGVKYDFNDTYTVRHKASPLTDNVIIETNLTAQDIGIQIFESCFQKKKSPITLEHPEQLEVYFKGVKGFKDINGIVFFEYTINIFDANGKEISSTSNTFDGDVSEMEYYPLTAFYDFKQLEPGTYKWHVQFKDASSDKFVKAIIDVII
jgi:hypothetical protein